MLICRLRHKMDTPPTPTAALFLTNKHLFFFTSLHESIFPLFTVGEGMSCMQEFQMSLCFFDPGSVADETLTRWCSAAPRVWLTLCLCVFTGSMNNILTQVESQLDESPVERRGSRAYQVKPIFLSVITDSCCPFLSLRFAGAAELLQSCGCYSNMYSKLL